MLRDYLDAKLRKRVYFGFAVVGTGLGATQVGFASAGAEQPVALTVALSVFAFLGSAVGFTAAKNTNA